MTYREIYAERNEWKALPAPLPIEPTDHQESVPFDQRTRSDRGNAGYAKLMGVNLKTVRCAGGWRYLKSLDPAIQRILLGISK
jgi:hypothetical protein